MGRSGRCAKEDYDRVARTLKEAGLLKDMPDINAFMFRCVENVQKIGHSVQACNILYLEQRYYICGHLHLQLRRFPAYDRKGH